MTFSVDGSWLLAMRVIRAEARRSLNRGICSSSPFELQRPFDPKYGAMHLGTLCFERVASAIALNLQ